MKRWIAPLLTATLLLGSVTSATALEIVEPEEWSSELVQSAFNGEGEVALHFPAGLELPVSAIISGDFLEMLDASQLGVVSVNRSFFVRFSGDDEFLFSEDAEVWYTFSEFIKGETYVGLTANALGNLIELKADLNRRSE